VQTKVIKTQFSPLINCALGLIQTKWGREMLSDHEFSILLEQLNRPWAGFRKVRRGVKKRIRRHMAELGCSTIEQYLVAISRPHARAVCEQCLRVTISRFFRDRPLWKTLQERILADLTRQFPSPLRIWSAGCACGEEAYSLAMLCKTLPHADPPIIVATDAQRDCLQRAREGIYGRGSLKALPDEMQQRYVDIGRKGRQVVVRKHLLPPIRWQVHDLMRGPVDGPPFHLILLRNNLLTYYQGRVLQDAFSKILSSLTPGGGLVIGRHERLPDADYPLIRDAGCAWVFWLQK
jgi:chemotaxis methyl-accepting protein methylase